MEYALQGGALTDALNFEPKAAGTASRSYRTTINPINAGDQPSGNIVRFDIPVSKHATFIDTSETYLLFTVQPSAAAAIDSSAYSLINRFTVLSQGAVLEDIQNYGNLCNTLLDLQMDNNTAEQSASIHLGTNLGNGLAIAANGTLEIALPLALSGVLGSGLSKYLPVQKINDLRLELTLENASGLKFAAAGGDWKMLDPRMVMTYVEIDPAMAASVDSAAGGRYVISSESWRNYATTFASSSSSSTLIPARYSSMRTFLHTWRDNAHLGLTDYSSARINPFASPCSIQYTIGPQLIPQQPIRGAIAESWMNTQESLHQLSSIKEGSRCTSASWALGAYPTTPGGGTTLGTFVFGQNLDSFQNKSATMTVGMNTISQPTFFNCAYGNTPAPTNLRLDTYAHFDMVLSIDDNGLTARY